MIKVGDLVWTDDVMVDDETYAIVTALEWIPSEVDPDEIPEGEDPEDWYSDGGHYEISVLVDGQIEEWTINDPEWDEDLGAWTFTW